LLCSESRCAFTINDYRDLYYISPASQPPVFDLFYPLTRLSNLYHPPANHPPKKIMSDLPITSMDDVEVTTVYDSTGMSTIKEVKYCYWLLGSVHDEDALYMGTIKDNTPPSEHSLEKIKKVLNRVEPELIFPPLPFPWWHVRTRVTVADDVDANPPPHLYFKRPWIGNLDVNDQVSYVALWFAHEIKQLEKLARCPPHPNLLRYHGCRVRKGRVTGALLGRVAGQDLHSHLESGGTINKNVFFRALESAIEYLHNVVGLVHNDIHPGNIMVSPDGVPTLIDLGAAFPEGEDILWGIPYVAFPPSILLLNRNKLIRV